jgi:creatine kinase
MGGEHSAMDEKGTADISPSARFGVKESYVTEMLYKGLINLYFIEQSWNSYTGIRFLADCRKRYLNEKGNVDWGKVRARWAFLKTIKESLANKFFTPEVEKKAATLSNDDQQRLLDIMMGGLENDDSSVGAYATRPEDYDQYGFYLEPLIKEYHKIQGNTKQEHDWNIPVGTYLLTNIDPKLTEVSMRARVARNVAGWNLPPKMDKAERIRFEETMVGIFEKFGIAGKYHSLTPGHKNFIEESKANELREKHFLFNDMTTDNHLTTSGVASDWPFGRGIWVSEDETKMIWIGEEDQLRIISIVKGFDLGAVDQSLFQLLSKIEGAGLKFAEHPTYGVITTCPTNMGTGKRQSILGKFPRITQGGTNEKALKDHAKNLGLQARGMGGEHSAMDKEGTADISPSARFGVKESFVTEKLYKGLAELYKIEVAAEWEEPSSCQII